MPLTPLHLGPGLLFGILTIRFFNLWAVLFGSFIMDAEPAILLMINPCYSCPHHGFFHSVFGAIFGSLILAAILYFFRKPLDEISLKLKIQQLFSFKILFFSALVAWLIHIFFDNLTHHDVFLFWPLKYKPFFVGPEIYWPLNFIFIILGMTSFILIKIKRPTSEGVRGNHSVSSYRKTGSEATARNRGFLESEPEAREGARAESEREGER